MNTPPPILASGPDANPWACVLHDMVSDYTYADDTTGDTTRGDHYIARAGRVLALTSPDGVRWILRYPTIDAARHAFAGFAAITENIGA